MRIQPLVAISTVETCSLAVLLVNLATVHNPAVSGVVGLLHGLAYLGIIASATLLSVPNRVKALSLVPGIGGFLLLRNAPDEARLARAHIDDRADPDAV
ncbi:hypothetical protein Mycsm_01835 [Mycobacterium sp. JS623]|uniref:hypothetical protein n=1 Tax=Mycobacterium sp. JS623 TaxID=212767 RepID=UPI0002A59075|nr:hypothetical protein [Mycobacterium sp. JS623]AGB22220.1 hypothetical protein Mycsm_01835 [Mycobacterium sp. JS623]